MYSGNSGQRRGLMRPVSAGSGPVFRNLPLFGFLTGLLFFFFIFYIYQAQSAELYDMRNEIELERTRYTKLKSENIDFKAQLEKCKRWGASLKNELQAVRLSQKECNGKLAKRDNVLLSYITNLKQLQDDKNTCFIALNSMKAELAVAKLTITTLRANSTSLESVLEMPKKPAKSLKARFQGKDAQESIPIESSLIVSPLSITQEDAAQNDQLNFLAPPFHLEKQSLQAENEKNPKSPNILDARLNIADVLGVNEQLSFVQRKDQMKRSVWDSNDIGKKQVVGNEYNN
ncbi:hypothetical protein WUBG_07067 [Wuchereria bancrofti]|uniref:Uncharacterized protein n=1 Tax=Wuchereria bancrofti TaxID=6293 RepID=J9F3X2_WUCBA|nr:hypothetical protein WUBG_07067 [Wuchereria bancrofti]VDM19662.1 unnamed protein product [Wuchereria bancrofti]